MTTLPRRRIEQSVLLAILARSVLVAVLGAWEIRRGLGTFAETQLAGLAAGRAAIDTLVAQLRLVPAAIAVLGGLAAGGAGLVGIGMVAASARQGARSRSALVASFHRVSRVLPLLVAAQVIGLASAVLGTSVFEASGLWFTPETDDRTDLLAFMGLVYAGLALWGGYATLPSLRRALRLFELRPMALTAIAVPETEAPGLFALLKDLARERGTTVPETVIVGTRASVFVSAHPVLLDGPPDAAPLVTTGRTLHLPLAGLATLDPMEALRLIIPPIGNQFNVMLKNSTLVSIIGVPELLLITQTINSATFRTFELYGVVALYYLMLTTAWTFVQSRIEARYAAIGRNRARPRRGWWRFKAVRQAGEAGR